MGKDVNGIVGDMMKFFDAKDQIAKIAAEPKGFGQSDTAKAFQTVMHLKELNDAETQLKDMLIWSGNAPVWHALIQERNNIVAKRKSEEIALTKKKEKRKKEIEEIITMALIAVLAALIITLSAWVTLNFVEGK
jgi:DnaJ-domain-containing protein 1